MFYFASFNPSSPPPSKVADDLASAGPHARRFAFSASCVRFHFNNGVVPSCPSCEGSKGVVHHKRLVSDFHRDQFAISDERGDFFFCET